MPRHLFYFVCAVVLVALFGSTGTSPSRAESANHPLSAGTSFELIDAVNVLRVSYGLTPYIVNSILMETAQAQADFMAATGDVTHSGPDGIGLTDRLLAAGYPLAGDLSAGGFRAENITSGTESGTAQSVVDSWTGDALHLNTMISPNLSEIGAGVAVANGRVYYVIDCALPITDGLPQSSTSVAGSGSTALSQGERISIPVISTPNSDGDIIHEVQPGQSLWQIAIVYEVTIDDIKRLNNLFDNNIYPGYKLLIKRNVILPTALPSELSATESDATSTTVLVSPTPNLLPTVTIIYDSPSAAAFRDNSVIGVVMGIIALGLLGGVVFAWLGSRKKTDN